MTGGIQVDCERSIPILGTSILDVKCARKVRTEFPNDTSFCFLECRNNIKSSFGHSKTQ